MYKVKSLAAFEPGVRTVARESGRGAAAAVFIDTGDIIARALGVPPSALFRILLLLGALLDDDAFTKPMLPPQDYRDLRLLVQLLQARRTSTRSLRFSPSEQYHSLAWESSSILLMFLRIKRFKVEVQACRI